MGGEGGDGFVQVAVDGSDTDAVGALLVFACFSGGMYVYLVPRPPARSPKAPKAPKATKVS